MDAAGGGPADHQRQVEALALHLGRHVAHLVERRRDQPGQSDDVDPLLPRRLEDAVGRHHHAEVDHLVVVALEDDADDVLADVVDVALHRGEQDAAGKAGLAGAVLALLLLHERHQVGDRLLHHPRRLHHLRQEHLAGAEQVADHVHAGHQRPFDHVQRRLGGKPRLLGVRLDEVGDALDERMLQPLVDRPLAPGEVGLLARRGAALVALGRLEQPFRRVGPPVEHHVLGEFAKLRIDVVIDRQCPGVDDAHVHAGGDRVIEEHRMHRGAHRLVAAEGEGEVGDTARDMGARQVLPDPARRLDKVDAVIVVLLDAGGDGEDVGVEDDVLRRHPDLFCQDAVGAGADLRLAPEGVGLALLVEGHHHHRRAIAAHLLRMLAERRLAFLHRDRIDDRLALHAFQPRLDHRPFRRVDHHRHAGDVGLGRHQVEEGDHGALPNRAAPRPC